MARRARKFRRKRNEGLGLATTGGILGIIAIAGIVSLLYLRSNIETTILDKNTLCDTTKKVDNVVAILIDTTDKLSSRTSRHVEKYFENFLVHLPVNSKISVYEVSGISVELNRPIISLCKPDDGSNANGMISNPEMIKKTFKSKFSLPLKEKLDSIMKNKTSDSTPLIESIQSAVVESFLDYPEASSKQIILVSDLLQHSDLYSFYSERPDYEGFFKKTKELGKGFVNLRGIKIHFLVAPSKVPVGTRHDVIKFWNDFMIKNHAEPGSTMEPLS